MSTEVAGSRITDNARLCARCGTPFRVVQRKRSGQTTCSPACRIEMHLRKTAKHEWFWRRVQRGDPASCWPWLGAKDGGGYGLCRWLQRQNQKAHRVAYEIHHGKHPGAMMVCHTCDNRSCCNPGHLFLGTATDNTQDAKAKGRLSHGCAHPTAKLNPVAVRVIRFMSKRRLARRLDLARAYRVTPRAITCVVERLTWAHVGDVP